MKTILAILKQAGGWKPGLSLRIVNAPYSDLIIEALDESGPCALPALSVAQYTNALAMPEIHFELGLAGGPHLNPFFYRNNYIGLSQWSRTVTRSHYIYSPTLHEQHERLARQWDKNLHVQGFAEAFERQRRQHA